MRIDGDSLFINCTPVYREVNRLLGSDGSVCCQEYTF